MKLKIAITADPELPVPPLLYGGIERIIEMLVKGYLERGHHVSLFAHEDSVIGAKLYPYPGRSSRNKKDFLKNAWLINKTLASGNYDIVHSFGRLAYLLPQLPLSIPKLMSYQREPTLSQVQKAVRIARKNTLAFTGCSDYISQQILPYAPSYTVYNGVSLNTYTFRKTVDGDAPLVFLGRIEPIKGAHTSVKIAQETGKKLVIAGNISSEYTSYFNEKIKPFLNEKITYVGPVNDQQKNELLGKAAALLMPIEWNEPFGIVMVEAMACGTPVIGFNRGAVSEVVVQGINGFSCNTVKEMILNVQRVSEINRVKVRQIVEERFSSDVISEEYLRIYYQLLKNNNKE